jgi:hypothetical protein
MMSQKTMPIHTLKKKMTPVDGKARMARQAIDDLLQGVFLRSALGH